MILKENKPKIIVILGPTATGKSDMAVSLAQKYNGEIISADSRQVYAGLDLGSGKITKKEMQGIKHYLLDVCDPKEIYSVYDFQKDSEIAISEILDKGKVPIIAGGTGFYIQSIVEGLEFPKIKTNFKLRSELEEKDISELQKILKDLDSKFYSQMDTKNKVRIIRAIEIIKTEGYMRPLNKKPKYECLQIGLDLDFESLEKKINTRIEKRLELGMIDEVANLHKNGLSWDRMHSLGLEYRYISAFLQGRLTKQEMIDILSLRIRQFAKRQMTWFKRDKNIHWINPGDMKSAEKLVDEFLGSLSEMD